MKVHFRRLTEPDSNHMEIFNNWENDRSLVPLIRPNPNKEALEQPVQTTLDEMKQRLEHQSIYLIYLDDKLIGEMNYMVDPAHLYKQVKGTAWIGITIGEPEGRGKGIGYQAIQFLEKQIRLAGLNRIELGVFEFNVQAQNLYRKMGYKEIAKIKDFTYWQDQMWYDIRMEKYL